MKKSKKVGRPPAGEDGGRVRNYPQISVRVPPDVNERLKRLLKRSKLSRLKFFEKALDLYEKSLSRR